jgi:glycosyltransferase involved in cell wall biosynthesis
MGKKIKVVFVVSDINKAVGFEWITENLDKTRFDISFVLLNYQPSYFAQYLQQKGIPVYEIIFQGKKQLPGVLWKVIKIFRKEKPDVIHTHMYIADLVGLAAGKILRVKKRIYTRHSSNESRKYYNRGRIDRTVNMLCTDVIAICNNVRNILHEQEHVPERKITVVHHGFDLDKFYNVTEGEIAEIRNKYNSPRKRPVIGVVARYSHWKGIQDIITAFKELLKEYPTALLVLANAKKGDYKDMLASLLSQLPEGSVCEIEFEHNIFALYHLFDVYVHTPIDKELEAFGQTYVEALAAGIPSVFTLSGVSPEFIIHEKNALVVNFQDPPGILAAIRRLLNDKSLCDKIVEEGKESVRDMFSLKRMMNNLEQLYSSK